MPAATVRPAAVIPLLLSAPMTLKKLRSLGHAAAILALAGLPLTGEASAPARPNVVFIIIDDLRDWVGYLGRHPQARTPNIDQLAARGVAFTRAYAASPSCNPSRAAVMSGLRPFTTGIYENDTDWRPAVQESMTLPSTFRRAGYHVCGAGKVYHTAFPRRSEWDDYLEDEGLLEGDNRRRASTAEYDQTGGEYDADGFFLNDGPNNNRSFRSRSRRDNDDGFFLVFPD